MRKHFRLLAFAALLPLLGFGCVQLGPRIVRTPQSAPAQNVAQVQAPQQAPAQSAVSSTALAYLKLDGGTAQVARGGKVYAAQEATELFSGDRITVTAGSVILIYPDAGASRLEAGTDVVLLSDGAKPQGLFVQLQLTAGKIWTRFERLLGKDEYFGVAANNVVATVRGTGFGVIVDANGVDFQVADHVVDVSIENVPGSTAAELAQAPIYLSAGQGFRLLARSLVPGQIKLLQSAVRQLSVAERLDAGFQFGLHKLNQELLQRPAHPYQLPAQPNVPEEYLPVQQMLLDQANAPASSTPPSGAVFVPPTRAPRADELNLLNVTPSVSGPTSTR